MSSNQSYLLLLRPLFTELFSTKIQVLETLVQNYLLNDLFREFWVI